MGTYSFGTYFMQYACFLNISIFVVFLESSNQSLLRSACQLEGNHELMGVLGADLQLDQTLRLVTKLLAGKAAPAFAV